MDSNINSKPMRGSFPQKLLQGGARGNSLLASGLGGLDGRGGRGEKDSFLDGPCFGQGRCVHAVKNIAAPGRIHGLNLEGGVMAAGIIATTSKPTAAFASGYDHRIALRIPESIDCVCRFAGTSQRRSKVR